MSDKADKTPDYETLLAAAKAAAENSYAPYSGFRVGAAILAGGKVFSGCNVENVSYSLAVCAERAAAVKAVGEGCREFSAVCVYHPGEEMPYPCGACRQFLSEFGSDMKIIVACDTRREEFTLKEIFPLGFKADSLKKTDKK